MKKANTIISLHEGVSSYSPAFNALSIKGAVLSRRIATCLLFLSAVAIMLGGFSNFLWKETTHSHKNIPIFINPIQEGSISTHDIEGVFRTEKAPLEVIEEYNLAIIERNLPNVEETVKDGASLLKKKSITDDVKKNKQNGQNEKQVASLEVKNTPNNTQDIFTMKIQKGDHLAKLLVRGGIKTSNANRVAQKIHQTYSLRTLKIGQKIRFTKFNHEVEKLWLRISPLNQIYYFKDQSGLETVNIIEIPTLKKYSIYRANINHSFIEAAIEAGLGRNVINNLILLFSFNIDFQRDIQKNDGFSVLVEILQDKETQNIIHENIVAASLKNRGSRHTYYRFALNDGNIDYFDEKGNNTRKSLLRTPIDGARVSSKFGIRKHPVLGYTRAHRGVDFAAPRGTPIYAAGDGIIEAIGRNGSYGKYIRIRHDTIFKTAYAHMHRYAKGLKKGARVQQGDVIGYVGSTGVSTGPHLHYEIIKNGVKVNPQKVKLPSSRGISKKELAHFKKYISSIEQQYQLVARN